MKVGPPFTEQVRLLVMLLPHVAKQDCFALKGGTAINLFLRDMPRLSVDIDLAYIPVENRDNSIAGIDDALFKITNDIEPLYHTEFDGMTFEPISLLDLEGTLSRLIQKIHGALTDPDRRFLVSFKKGEADWSAFPIPDVERLPAIQWKMLNLNRMDRKKRQNAIIKLEKVLQG